MIKLNIEPYCHGCTKFNPVVHVITMGDLIWEQVVYCSGHDKCKAIERHITSKLKEKEEENA